MPTMYEKKPLYEVWVRGYNEDDTINDYEKWIATFRTKELALVYLLQNPLGKPNDWNTPKTKAVIEECTYDTDNGDIIYVITEQDL